MSELKVNSIVDASSGNTVQINGMTPTADSLQGFRNRIINGDMRIDQRNAGASVTINAPSPTYILDRWRANGQTTDGVFTVQQSTTAPPGFTNSLVATVTTADASIGSTQFYLLSQSVEGLNFSDLGWGTASAKTITISFWVRSSVTGTFSGSIKNSTGDRSYPFIYTISVADTFEYKTVEIEGDTSGTWLTTNGIGASLLITTLGSGSDRLGTANAWAGANYDGATGSVALIATSAATLFITGVQLEAGSVATPFERRPFGAELALCERYFLAYGGSVAVSQALASGVLTSTTAFQGYCGFPTEMRAAPTLTTVGSFNLRSAGSFDATVTGGSLGKESASIGATVSGATAGQGAVLRSQGNTLMDGVLLFSAEL